MEFRIVFDSIEAKGMLTLYEAWSKGKGKDKINKQILQEEPIGTVDFVVDNLSLTVTNLDVVEKYRRRGLGRLIMNVIFALSIYYNRKVELVSGSNDASKFYRAIGMRTKKGETDEFVWQAKKKVKIGFGGIH